MAPFFQSVERRKLQLIIRWCILPAAVLLAIFFPPLLLPFILTLLPLAVVRTYALCVPVAGTRSCSRPSATLRLRGPPAR